MKKQGFSLVELMAAMVILAVLSMLAMPMAEITYLRDSEDQLRYALIETRDAIDRFYRDHNYYPRSFYDLFFDPVLKKPYLRHSPPINPFTKDIYGWVVICSETKDPYTGKYYNPTYPIEKFMKLPFPRKTGIFDIRCKSSCEDPRIPVGVSLDGKTTYDQW